MKLASYKDGSRDGQLVVVSRDLATAHYANGIATRLQQVLDDWNFLSPQLEDLANALNHGRARHAFPFDPALCMAPLPRAYGWLVGSAYPQAGATGHAAAPLRHGASDVFLGPTDPIPVPSEKMGIDFEAGLAVITGDVAVGTPADRAIDAVRLVLLANDIHLRALAPAGGVQALPATAFGPVAVTPDELGAAWQGGRVHLTLHTSWNGKRLGRVPTGPGMQLHFGELIAQVARTRAVRAGTLVGSGAVRHDDASAGHASLAHRPATEGAPATLLRFGDTLRIEARGTDGPPIFGAIDQAVAGLDGNEGEARRDARDPAPPADPADTAAPSAPTGIDADADA